MLHHEVSATVRHPRLEPADVRDVVVAVDGGWASRRALEQGAREAQRRGARLVVATVITTSPVQPAGWATWSRAERDAGEHARVVNVAAQRRVRDREPRLAVEGVVVDSVAGLDSVAEHAGLLVLGRRGAGGQGVFRLGSTSGDLVRVFRCPVLVCRDEQTGRARIAPTSRNSEVVAAVHVPPEIPTVLRQAVQEASIRAMPLCVFSSGRTPSSRLVETALSEVKSVAWRLVWTAGDEAAEALLRYADPDDLLVLGNRGVGRLAGHVPMSVTRAVLDEARCDVMLVPV